jgi:hypothetical protein
LRSSAPKGLSFPGFFCDDINTGSKASLKLEKKLYLLQEEGANLSVPLALGPDDKEVGDRRVRDPSLGPVDHIATPFLACASGHATRVRAVSRFGKALKKTEMESSAGGLIVDLSEERHTKQPKISPFAESTREHRTSRQRCTLWGSYPFPPSTCSSAAPYRIDLKYGQRLF